MAFIRQKKSGDNTYYQLVRSRRVNGQPRQQVLAYLGKHATVEKALEDCDRRAEECRYWEDYHRTREMKEHGKVLPAGQAATYREYAEEWEVRAQRLRELGADLIAAE